MTEPEPPLDEMIDELAQAAVHLANEHFRINLDFSEESLQQVETILDTYHKALPKGMMLVVGRVLKRAPSDEAVRRMALVWGGYIGEVIRRRWGGEWTTEPNAPVGTALTLRVHEVEIFPPGKAYKRLTNGPEDNVWYYYQVLRRDMAPTSLAETEE